MCLDLVSGDVLMFQNPGVRSTLSLKGVCNIPDFVFESFVGCFMNTLLKQKCFVTCGLCL